GIGPRSDSRRRSRRGEGEAARGRLHGRGQPSALGGGPRLRDRPGRSPGRADGFPAGAEDLAAALALLAPLALRPAVLVNRLAGLDGPVPVLRQRLLRDLSPTSLDRPGPFTLLHWRAQIVAGPLPGNGLARFPGRRQSPRPDSEEHQPEGGEPEH